MWSRVRRVGIGDANTFESRAVNVVVHESASAALTATTVRPGNMPALNSKGSADLSVLLCLEALSEKAKSKGCESFVDLELVNQHCLVGRRLVLGWLRLEVLFYSGTRKPI